MDFCQALIPHNVKLRNLFFQLTQPNQHLMDIRVHRKLNPIRQDRLEDRLFRFGLIADSLAGKGIVKAHHRTDRAGRCFLHCGKSGSRIDADLVRLFFPKHLLYFQHASGDFHMR